MNTTEPAAVLRGAVGNPSRVGICSATVIAGGPGEFIEFPIGDIGFVIRSHPHERDAPQRILCHSWQAAQGLTRTGAAHRKLSARNPRHTFRSCTRRRLVLNGRKNLPPPGPHLRRNLGPRCIPCGLQRPGRGARLRSLSWNLTFHGRPKPSRLRGFALARRKPYRVVGAFRGSNYS